LELLLEVFPGADRSERREQQEGEDCEFVHDCFPWIFFFSPSSVYSTIERSLSAHCPTFKPRERDTTVFFKKNADWVKLRS
jgi:hypothetical protein